MGKIYVNTDAVSNLKSNFRGKAASCREYSSRANIIRNNIDWEVLRRRNINYRLNKLRQRIQRQSSMLTSLSNAAGNVRSSISDTDNRVRKEANKLACRMNRMSYMNYYLSNASPRSCRIWDRDLRRYTFAAALFGGKILGAVLSSKPYIKNTYLEYLNEDSTHSKFDAFFMGKMKISESVIHRSTGVDGTLLGAEASADATGDLLGYDASVKNFADWDPEKGEISAKTKAMAVGYLAKGEASAAFGLAEVKAKGEFLTGTAIGEAKAALWQEGEFKPALTVGAAASVAVLKGEANGQFGTDDYNAHIRARGDVLSAEAKASAAMGALGKNDKGKEIYGVRAKAGAEACVAKGEVSGGVTILGVKVYAKVQGKAIAAGASASAELTNEGASAEVGAALGLGAGVKLSVDWSGADWIEDAGDSIGKAADKAGKAIGKFSESVAEWGRDLVGAG